MVSTKKISDSKFQFEVHTASGVKLLDSIYFSSEKDLKKVVSNLPKIVQSTTGFERKTDYGGQFIFHVKDTIGNIVGKSGTYASEAGMENGIKNLKESILIDETD